MKTLQEAYEAIFLAHQRGTIDRKECHARVIALRDSPLAAGLTFDQRNAIANKAVSNAAKIMDDVWFEQGGRWQ